MPDSDKALCARLAEWQGWRWVQVLSLQENRLVPPHEAATYLEEWLQKGKNPEWPDRPYLGPFYDTDPVAALELLDWLAEKGWRVNVEHEFCGDLVKVCVRRLRKIWQEPVQRWAVAEGPPSIALPKAIALVAVEVLESEESDG